MFSMISSLNLLGSARSPNDASFPSRARASASSRLTDFALEAVIRLDLFFHLGLDFLKVLGRDAMRQFDIVVKAGSRPADRRRIALPARVAK